MSEQDQISREPIGEKHASELLRLYCKLPSPYFRRFFGLNNPGYTPGWRIFLFLDNFAITSGVKSQHPRDILG
jgi:hypothetical protein